MHPNDYLGKVDVAKVKRGVGCANFVQRAVDGVDVHGRVHRRSCAPYLTCRSIARSFNSRKKSAFQYHWRPAGYSASNMPCSAGKGIGPAKSTAGGPKARMGLKRSSAWSMGPV